MKYRYLIIFVILALIVDRLAKLGIILSGAEFTKNPGLAFGLGRGVPGILIFLIILGLVVLIYFSKSLNLNLRSNQIALGLIVGGGVSNILDRLFYGYVIDFVNLGSLSSFNFADLSIIGGSLMLIIYFWQQSRYERR